MPEQTEKVRLPADWWPAPADYERAVERWGDLVDVEAFTKRFVAANSRSRKIRKSWPIAWRSSVAQAHSAIVQRATWEARKAAEAASQPTAPVISLAAYRERRLYRTQRHENPEARGRGARSHTYRCP